MSRTVAAVDIGTNSTRLLVADVEGGRIVAEHAREMVITRLGQGVDRARRFEPEALRRTLDVVAGYAATCRRLGVTAVRVIATSATRDAANRAELSDGVRRLLGVEPEVPSGELEARTAFLGATHDLDGSGPVLVIDLGGGSTELIWGTGGVPVAERSLDLGCVRLTERHLHDDPPTAAQVAALRADAAAQLRPAVADLGLPPHPRAVGVAGTITTVVGLALDLDAYDPTRIHRATVAAGRLTAVAERLAAMTVAERAALPVVAPGREDVIAAGALLLDETCRVLQIDALTASETDILDGVAIGLI